AAVAAVEPEPTPVVVEAATQAPEPGDDGPADIDLSEPPFRRCRATAPAPHVRRCRRSTDRPLGGPCRGRGPPPPPPSCGPGPPWRRAEVASSATRAPPAVVASGRPPSIWPTPAGH